MKKLFKKQLKKELNTQHFNSYHIQFLEYKEQKIRSALEKSDLNEVKKWCQYSFSEHKYLI